MGLSQEKNKNGPCSSDIWRPQNFWDFRPPIVRISRNISELVVRKIREFLSPLHLSVYVIYMYEARLDKIYELHVHVHDVCNSAASWSRSDFYALYESHVWGDCGLEAEECQK